MRRLVAAFVLLSVTVTAPCRASTNVSESATVIIVVGAAGEEQFGDNFAKWAGSWEKAAGRAAAQHVTIGLDTNSSAATDLERLKERLQAEPKRGMAELWLVLIGHGTFDGRDAKFNLRGPDLSATNLAGWLKPFERPLAVIDGASSSSPFITKLSAPGRVIVTATRSGYEQNYSRFGQFMADAIADPAADLDKDGQTSLLEAFLIASRHTAEFYETEGRLASEHALLDDNGDGLGTPADWFRGIRAVKRAKEGAAPDGLRAHQLHLVRSDLEQNLTPEVRAKRDELELAVAKFRETKPQMSEDEYYRKLENLLLELAKLYEPTSLPSLPAAK